MPSSLENIYSTYQKFGNAREKLMLKADFRHVPKNQVFHKEY
jgi:hypothetical protein